MQNIQCIPRVVFCCHSCSCPSCYLNYNSLFINMHWVNRKFSINLGFFLDSHRQMHYFQNFKAELFLYDGVFTHHLCFAGVWVMCQWCTFHCQGIHLHKRGTGAPSSRWGLLSSDTCIELWGRCKEERIGHCSQGGYTLESVLIICHRWATTKARQRLFNRNLSIRPHTGRGNKRSLRFYWIQTTFWNI